jgi:tripartite-type tricarboxylate transporter receptor subunit TctC
MIEKLLRLPHTAAVLLLFAAAAAPVAAQPAAYPSRPVHIVVPFEPGSVTDILARIVGDRLAASMGQPVIVDNKPGAGGNIGAGDVAAAAPDGYTLLMGPVSTNAINPSLYKNLKYAPLRDFAPITNVATVTNVLVVPAAVPAHSVKELIALMKSKAGDFAYASGGAGGAQHLSAELFKSMTGTQATHVPYKGGAPALSDLLTGRVQMMFCNLPICLPHIRSGKLVALGVTGARRSVLLPDVPTMGEAGLPGCGVDGWFGLFSPSRVPAPIQARLHREVVAILQRDDVRKQLLAQGAEPVGNSQQDFGVFVKNEHDKWARVIHELGITIE